MRGLLLTKVVYEKKQESSSECSLLTTNVAAKTKLSANITKTKKKLIKKLCIIARMLFFKR